ncbi:hypothetical protein ADL04_00725 [Streptomyces sp. NRRL B-3648]|nr:hypothetical protein ADL04_00725 [Streptomyces sp. NRRL B-3648]
MARLWQSSHIRMRCALLQLRAAPIPLARGLTEQAHRITAQVRREADAILAEARKQAERIAAVCAEIVMEPSRTVRKLHSRWPRAAGRLNV